MLTALVLTGIWCLRIPEVPLEELSVNNSHCLAMCVTLTTKTAELLNEIVF